ncbi:hypothetical protein AB0B66_09820 [Catellatospora sp. NPDC049111]|uniref:hypothetical protein n=1 Tax=Catellatospora sp. NPDC049111 TaxID=3155271 RepID=UPI0033EBADA3
MTPAADTSAQGRTEYRTLTVSLRPSRHAVGYPASEDWVDVARRAVGDLSRFWGGGQAVLLPIGADGGCGPVLLNVLRAYDPDYVGRFVRTSSDRSGQQLDAFDGFSGNYANEHEGLSIFQRRLRDRGREADDDSDWPRFAEQIDQWCSPHVPVFASGGVFQPMFMQIHNADHNVDPARGDLPFENSNKWFTLDLSAVPDQFALMIETRVGSLASSVGKPGVLEVPVHSDDYPALAELAITGRVHGLGRLVDRYRQVARAAGHSPAELTTETFEGMTPFARTRQWTVQLNNGMSPPLIIVAGDSADDHALAMLCDRTYGNAAWLPATAARGDDEVGAAIREVTRDLWNGWAHPLGVRPQEIWLVSTSMADRDLAALAEELAPEYASSFDASLRPEPWLTKVTLNSLHDQPWHRWLGDADYFKLPLSVPVHVTDTAVELPTPLLTPVPDARGHLGEELRWQVDVMMPGHHLPQLTAPERRLLNIDDAGAFTEAHVRISHLGLCFASDKAGYAMLGAGPVENLARPRLRFPTALSIFAEAARRKGATVRVSNAGRRASLALRKWGSLEALTDALQGPCRLLLNAFVAPRPSGDYGIGYSLRSKGYVSHEYAARVVGEGARYLLDELNSRSLVRRGLILTCERCNSRDFIPIAAIADTYDCIACGSPNHLVNDRWAKHVVEPEWFYDLDPVMRDLLRDNGDVPLLAIARLRENALSVLYCPELEIVTARSGGPEVETDICVIIDGQIVTGEAKSNGSLDGSSRKSARKIVKAAEILGANRIVMATSADDWAPGVRTAVDEALAASTPYFWRGEPTIKEMTAVRPAAGGPPADYSELLKMDPQLALTELLALPAWAGGARRDALVAAVRAGLAGPEAEAPATDVC